MPIPKELALTPNQIDEIMSTTWNMRIATMGPAERINLTPLWFGWAGGRVYTFCRGQKVANLRRNPSATVLVDLNERYPELQGIMLQGRASVLEDAAAEKADPFLEQARVQMGGKYATGRDRSEGEVRNESTSGGRNRRWVVLEPDRVVTWDNYKLSQIKR
ncbi:MAG: hypothetical protein CL897_06615 [Dehalococcoidia bacterium]|nr:hypothetical protein [Dehalococcoidia bacterium]HCU99879.1 hypothetical protein [Dehalococcoidia bacterium]|tara:strand:+ start:94 stop:576 length:483 start_codon:yes stop_codon:yes gene_type:complete